MRVPALMSVLLILLAINFSARADDSLKIHDFQWRHIAGDRSFASSDCVGETDTIECMVDTLIACTAWSHYDDELGRLAYDPVCDTPGVDRETAAFYMPGQYFNRLTWFYYLTDTWPATEYDDVGDVVVDIHMMICHPKLECIRRVGGKRPVPEILELCPRTDCNGSPYLMPEHNALLPPFRFELERSGQNWRLTRATNWMGIGASVELQPDERWLRGR